MPRGPKYAFFRILHRRVDQRLFSHWVHWNVILTHSITFLILQAWFFSYKAKRLEFSFGEKIRVEVMLFDIVAIFFDQLSFRLFQGVHWRKRIEISSRKDVEICVGSGLQNFLCNADQVQIIWDKSVSKRMPFDGNVFKFLGAFDDSYRKNLEL